MLAASLPELEVSFKSGERQKNLPSEPPVPSLETSVRPLALAGTADVTTATLASEWDFGASQGGGPGQMMPGSTSIQERSVLEPWPRVPHSWVDMSTHPRLVLWPGASEACEFPRSPSRHGLEQVEG